MKFRQRYQRIFEGSDAPFQLQIKPLLGIPNERLAPVTLAQYESGKQQLLDILHELKEATAASAAKSATLHWNGEILSGQGRTFAIAAAGPEEKEAAKFFRSTLFERTGIVPSRDVTGKIGMTVVFELGETPCSYQISREKERIILRANSVKNLKLAAGNWINTMEIDAAGF